MVRFLCLLFLCAPLYGEEVQITAEIEGVREGEPLSGLITVTHDRSVKIDSNRFFFQNNPLSVEAIREVMISPGNPLTLSIFKFTLREVAKIGLQVFPGVTLKIDGKSFSSIPTTYYVLDRITLSTDKSGPEPVLKLEAGIEGISSLYPGERTRFVYRYIYQGNIVLTKEYLPLLEPEGFIKIGEKEIQNARENSMNVQTITQMVQASRVGNFAFGPSILEGYSYELDSRGNKILSSKMLHSQAPVLSVQVLVFPEQGKPPSFQGAIGKYSFSVSLLSSPEVFVEDEIILAITIKGKNLQTVSVPQVCCQPGFPGFFLVSTIFPEMEMSEDSKKYIVKIRPLSAAIQEVPSIEFSSFDPSSQEYIVLQSVPIPIKVNIHPEIVTPAPKEEREEYAFLSPEEKHIKNHDPLTGDDLHNKLFGTWWALGIIPLGIGILIYQAGFIIYLRKKRLEPKCERSEELFKKALKQYSNTPSFFSYIEKALKTHLVEKNEIISSDIPCEDLGVEGDSGKVRKVLLKMEEWKYGKGSISPHILSEEAKNLFLELEARSVYREC